MHTPQWRRIVFTLIILLLAATELALESVQAEAQTLLVMVINNSNAAQGGCPSGTVKVKGQCVASTATRTSPTATSVPPTATSVPPTATSVPPTATPVSIAPTLHVITFTPSSEDFANPERGMMRQKNIYPDQGTDQLRGIRRDNPADSLVWIYFRLDNYRDRPLDEAGLSLIRAAFADARTKGLKLVVRFSYNEGPGWTYNPALATPDAPLELALQHIEQLKPILQENADVTAVLQAGFVGHWGEWHSSRYLDSMDARRSILDALLAALPADRMLQLRYPRYKEAFFGPPLTEGESYSGISKARIGEHNDCFLSEEDDSGTYRSQNLDTYCQSSPQGEIACWRSFASQESAWAPVGGETCEVNPPRTDCANATQELAQFHWSFLHNGYLPEVLDGWTAQGCMPEIRLRLGYRFVFQSASFPTNLAPGEILALELRLRNVGYAAPYNPRPVWLVLRGPGGRYAVPLDGVDIRRWQPGTDLAITAQAALPLNMTPGDYQLSLWLPDPVARLQSIPAYALRLANLGSWDPTTGENRLTLDGSQVHIATSADPFIIPKSQPVELVPQFPAGMLFLPSVSVH